MGFSLAAGSALTWALYSLLTRRVAPFASWAIGGFAAASGALALLCHALFEPAAAFAPGTGSSSRRWASGRWAPRSTCGITR
jgi:drug/metabolite transporter (DMT)-like permease